MSLSHISKYFTLRCLLAFDTGILSGITRLKHANTQVCIKVLSTFQCTSAYWRIVIDSPTENKYEKF